ncbi:hypothetical protein A2159_01245 [Candidatus Woesebacteria bacterium RBG_13_34_9]|uniref:Uncharacterized protein n=1 Tax=Candidatus Woesebacteria bacterium RBG_13_34_9 TaxID=1802477 RepID=A0A1F7X200_9BACT|nr:MAG: hypothetical protein A2159_01245 [Candidatus Woesebacteria bacterium RBG_13_34_9]
MSDIVSPEINNGLTPEVINKPETPFYPGISSNRLYFHGTRSKESLDSILSNGLEPPATAVSKDTLARRISFTDFNRYSGSQGFILGIMPEKGEINEIKPMFAREARISSDLDRLPPERTIFYLPGSNKLTREIFYRIREDVNRYFEAGFENELLINNLNQMVKNTEEGLHKEATIINDNNPGHVHLIAQEIVWNELCGYTTHLYDDLSFDAKIIMDIQEKQVITSSDQLLSATEKVGDFVKFDSKAYLNNLRFLSNIENIKGLGFEDLNYPIKDQVKEIGKWLVTLPSNNKKSGQAEEASKQNRIGRLIAQLRGIGKK